MNALARRVESLGQIVDDRLQRCFAGTAFDDLGGDGVGLEHPLRRQQNPASLMVLARLFWNESVFWDKSTWRDVSRRDVGVIEPVQHCP
jgi:hypothetical protein